MAKALTREDLLYILQSIFKLSEQEDNAFKILEDGLYVKDYNNDLQLHAIDPEIKEIIAGFTVNENGLLLYNGNMVSTIISKKEGNSVTFELDGLYVPEVAQNMADHLIEQDIHVTVQDKDKWDKALQESKDFTLEELNKLIILNIEIVTALPKPITVSNPEQQEEGIYEENIIYPSSTTLYLLADDPDCPEECTYTMHMYLQDKWVKLNVTNQTLGKFALKTELEDAIGEIHKHENKEVIDKFSASEDGDLLYDGQRIREIGVSDKEGNAAKLIDGKIYVYDFDNEIKSMQSGIGGFTKYNLYDEEIKDSGVYKLKDYIDNYSMLLIEYYYRPNNENESPGCAKTAVIDTDTLDYLYSKNMDYMLEYGYGILTSNSKIRMHENKLWVDYYHNVCIYRITGIVRRGNDNE